MTDRRLQAAILATTLATLVTSTALAVDSHPTDTPFETPGGNTATPVFDSGFVVIAEDQSNDTAFIVIAEDNTNDAGFLVPVVDEPDPANTPPFPQIEGTP